MNNITALMRVNNIGQAPKIVVTPQSSMALFGSFCFGFAPCYQMSNNLTLSLSIGVLSSLTTWVTDRYVKLKDNNEGWHWMTDPLPEAQKIKQHNKMDAELTELYRKTYSDENIVVERAESSQYNIHVIYHDDSNIMGKIEVLARKLGIESKPGQTGKGAIPCIYYSVWGKGASALLWAKEPKDWHGTIDFDESALVEGAPVAYLGLSVKGEPITVDHRIEHGLLIAGTSGSGKTVAFVTHHQSMVQSGLDPLTYIIDLKNTAQLKRLPSVQYANTTTDAINMLHYLVGVLKERQERYTQADVDDIWEYRAKVDNSEQPIIIYLDELAKLSRIDEGEDEKENKAMSLEAMRLLTDVAQMGRSAGLLPVFGMQHPTATDLPTKIRNQLMARLILAMADHHAADVAGVPGSQNQPMKGACMLKHAGKLEIGRAAFLKQ